MARITVPTQRGRLVFHQVLIVQCNECGVTANIWGKPDGTRQDPSEFCGRGWKSRLGIWTCPRCDALAETEETNP